MAFAVESLGTLFLNLAFFGTGLAFAIIGLILGISRSMTKNQNHWGIIFSAFAWTISLIIPNVWFAGMVFGIGAFALTLSFMPIIEKAGDKNIFVLAIICGVLNLLLLVGSGSYVLGLDWQSNMNDTLTDIEGLISPQISVLSDSTPETKLCVPSELDSNNQSCQTDVVSGSFDMNLFVPFASVLTIGTYIGKAVAFIGMVALAPIILTFTLTATAYFTNTIILYLMGSLIILWEMAIFYKLIAFILNKRGMR